MKNYYFIVMCLIVFGINTINAQVNLGIQLSAGSLNIEAPYNNYKTGFQSGLGFMVFDEMIWIKDLSWETGLEVSFGQTGFYALKSGGFTVTNGNYPLNKSEKILHRLWTLNLPLKLRYNAFGFMGILGNIELSYLLDGNIHIRSQSRTSRILTYRKITPILEGGLFFPIGKKMILEGTAFRAIEDRFYTGTGRDANGNDVNVNGHRDFGFGVNIMYKLN